VTRRAGALCPGVNAGHRRTDVSERMVVALMASWPLLVEGGPGLAKTLAVQDVADALGVESPANPGTRPLGSRPTSVGTRIYTRKLGPFDGILARSSPKLVWPTRSTGHRESPSASGKPLHGAQVTMSAETQRSTDQSGQGTQNRANPTVPSEPEGQGRGS